MAKVICLFGVLMMLVFPGIVLAHLQGQQPFFKVNGEYSKLYPVPASSLPDFPLPQDIADGVFVVDQPINFEFDIAKLPAPPEVVRKTKFLWDFGDGSNGEGLKNTHIYKKNGSFILVVEVETADSPRQIIQSVMINILPNKDYKLPQSIIKINGKTSKDPLTDPFRIKFDEDISLDGSDSKASSSKIVSYFWDLGDRQSATQAKLTHRYSNTFYNAIVVLRVKDQAGFLGDSFVEIINEEDNLAKKTDRVVQKTITKNEGLGVKLLIFGVVLLLVAIGLVFFRNQRRR